MQEKWKEIKDYDGEYYVSNFGRVRNKTRLLNPYKTQKGYRGVRLTKNNVVKNYLVHRLVATAFIDNPNNYPTVNHKDENKDNNRTDNLEWCSYSYNNNYGNRNKTVSEKMSVPVICIDEVGNRERFNSLREGALSKGCFASNIWKVLSGKRKTTGGYRWIYAEK